MKIENNLKWISSKGGPLILMPQPLLQYWNGIYVLNTYRPNFATDYDRACNIEEYVGVINIADEKGLVLGDLPSHTSYVSVDPETVILVRWVWADDEEQVERILREMSLDQHWIDTNIRILFDSGNLVLFDSAQRGNTIDDFLNIDVNSGNYKISTFSYQPNKELNLFLILMTRTV